MAEVFDTISGGVKGLDPSNLFSIMNNPIMNKAWFFIKVGIWIIICIGTLLFLWKFFKQYSVRVTIRRRIGTGAIETKRDWAKMVIDDQDKRKLQLFRLRDGKKPITFPVPDSVYKGKVGRWDHYDVFIDDNFQAHPIMFNQNDFGHQYLKIMPEDRKAWARWETKRIMEKYSKKEWVEKYLPSIIVLSSMMVAFMIFFFMSKELGSSLSELANQFAQVASSCTRMG